MCDDLVERVARAILKAVDAVAWEEMEEYERADYRREARAALASIEAAGYVVVPREPTERCKRALEQCAADFSTPPGTFNEVSRYISQEFRRRMLLANDALSLTEVVPEPQKTL